MNKCQKNHFVRSPRWPLTATDKWGIARPNPSAVCAAVAVMWEVQVESHILRIQKAWNNGPELRWGLQQTLALKCIEMRRHRHLPLGPCRCSFWQVVTPAKPAFLPQRRLQKQHMSHEKESSGRERGLKKDRRLLSGSFNDRFTAVAD